MRPGYSKWIRTTQTIFFAVLMLAASAAAAPSGKSISKLDPALNPETLRGSLNQCYQEQKELQAILPKWKKAKRQLEEWAKKVKRFEMKWREAYRKSDKAIDVYNKAAQKWDELNFKCSNVKDPKGCRSELKRLTKIVKSRRARSHKADQVLRALGKKRSAKKDQYWKHWRTVENLNFRYSHYPEDQLRRVTKHCERLYRAYFAARKRENQKATDAQAAIAKCELKRAQGLMARMYPGDKKNEVQKSYDKVWKGEQITNKWNREAKQIYNKGYDWERRGNAKQARGLYFKAINRLWKAYNHSRCERYRRVMKSNIAKIQNRLEILKKTGTIRVVSATYGGNCSNPRCTYLGRTESNRVRTGNATGHIAGVCNGKPSCTYRIDYNKIGGDPCIGCVKKYHVAWRCGNKPKVHNESAGSGTSDAGLGMTVHLSCQ